MFLLYIMYDIVIVCYIVEDLVVMYVGYMVEWGDIDEIIYDLQYFYIKLLVFVVFDLKKLIYEKLEGNKGEILLWILNFVGCLFVGCCLYVFVKCCEVLLEVIQLFDNYFVCCYLFEK